MPGLVYEKDAEHLNKLSLQGNFALLHLRAKWYPQTASSTMNIPSLAVFPKPFRASSTPRASTSKKGVHTNSPQSIWASVKWSQKGICFNWSPKHLSRYITEICCHFNLQDLSTLDTLSHLVRSMTGRCCPTWNSRDQTRPPVPGHLQHDHKSQRGTQTIPWRLPDPSLLTAISSE